MCQSGNHLAIWQYEFITDDKYIFVISIPGILPGNNNENKDREAERQKPGIKQRRNEKDFNLRLDF